MNNLVLEIENLSKKYDDYVLKKINLKLEKGKLIAILGSDGSGKTTLLRLIAGLICKSEGEIKVLNLNPLKEKTKLMQYLGYMPQKFGLYEDLTVIENINLYAKLKNDTQSVDKMLEFTRLKPFKKRLAHDLSGGMKQKLGLACALLSNPKLLILDEPTVGVDPLSRIELLELVKQAINPKTSVIWSSSYLDESYNFDLSIILNKGEIIFQGSAKTLGADYEEFEKEVIELMGGYKEEESVIAKNYHLAPNDIECCVLADNLSKKYGDFWAVKNNSFCIKKGEIFGLLGPNGAGKSTTFKMMCALVKPTSGKGYIMGTDIEKEAQKARSYLGYMSQKFSLYSRLSVLDNLNFFAGVYGLSGKNKKEKIERIMKVFDLEHYKDMQSSELPLGFKQRLSLSCALIHEPNVLFLDEPTSGVDIIQRKEFWGHIKKLSQIGVSILVTTHFMDEAKFCDKISLFNNGEIIALDTPCELIKKANAKNMNEAFIELIKRRENE
ncbi:MAG: ABC transporter ATP-binding protein [Candidatus Gastranaerophilales bacterium]|nr:ABC transporter ATP-binding protein [Candidatus Gastranaerophilales bacterium]